MPPHHPSESQILASYLLHPSPLPTILSYKSFLALLPSKLPSSQQNSSQLRRLYHDLQFQRDILVDDVRRRIEGECHRSVGLTARLSRQIRQEEGNKKDKKRKRGEIDAGKEGMFDTAMHNGIPLSNTIPESTSKHNHSTTSLLSAIETAAEDLHAEIADLETNIERLRSECEEKVGNLSDLRYGKFSAARVSGNTTGGSGIGGGAVEDEVITALRDLQGRLEGGGQGRV